MRTGRESAWRKYPLWQELFNPNWGRTRHPTVSWRKESRRIRADQLQFTLHRYEIAQTAQDRPAFLGPILVTRARYVRARGLGLWRHSFLMHAAGVAPANTFLFRGEQHAPPRHSSRRGLLFRPGAGMRNYPESPGRGKLRRLIAPIDTHPLLEPRANGVYAL
jgi:hypothetical protein